MNIGRFRFLGAVFIVAAMLSVAGTSHALPPRGSHLEGVVTALDMKARRASLVTDAGRAVSFTWNRRTRFVTASPLRKGARVAIVYHQPFFGEPFVSRVSVAAPVQRDALSR